MTNLKWQMEGFRLGMRASSLPLMASKTETDGPRLFVAMSFPSFVIARL
jgi:hypothetical protein